jgi:hypothetical protein
MDLDAFQTFSSKNYRRAGISFVRCGGVTNVSHRFGHLASAIAGPFRTILWRMQEELEAYAEQLEKQGD